MHHIVLLVSIQHRFVPPFYPGFDHPLGAQAALPASLHVDDARDEISNLCERLQLISRARQVEIRVSHLVLGHPIGAQGGIEEGVQAHFVIGANEGDGAGIVAKVVVDVHRVLCHVSQWTRNEGGGGRVRRAAFGILGLAGRARAAGFAR